MKYSSLLSRFSRLYNQSQSNVQIHYIVKYSKYSFSTSSLTFLYQVVQDIIIFNFTKIAVIPVAPDAVSVCIFVGLYIHWPEVESLIVTILIWTLDTSYDNILGHLRYICVYIMNLYSVQYFGIKKNLCWTIRLKLFLSSSLFLSFFYIQTFL